MHHLILMLLPSFFFFVPLIVGQLPAPTFPEPEDVGIIIQEQSVNWPTKIDIETIMVPSPGPVIMNCLQMMKSQMNIFTDLIVKNADTPAFQSSLIIDVLATLRGFIKRKQKEFHDKLEGTFSLYHDQPQDYTQLVSFYSGLIINPIKLESDDDYASTSDVKLLLMNSTMDKIANSETTTKSLPLKLHKLKVKRTAWLEMQHYNPVSWFQHIVLGMARQETVTILTKNVEQVIQNQNEIVSAMIDTNQNLNDLTNVVKLVAEHQHDLHQYIENVSNSQLNYYNTVKDSLITLEIEIQGNNVIQNLLLENMRIRDIVDVFESHIDVYADLISALLTNNVDEANLQIHAITSHNVISSKSVITPLGVTIKYTHWDNDMTDCYNVNKICVIQVTNLGLVTPGSNLVTTWDVPNGQYHFHPDTQQMYHHEQPIGKATGLFTSNLMDITASLTYNCLFSYLYPNISESCPQKVVMEKDWFRITRMIKGTIISTTTELKCGESSYSHMTAIISSPTELNCTNGLIIYANPNEESKFVTLYPNIAGFDLLSKHVMTQPTSQLDKQTFNDIKNSLIEVMRDADQNEIVFTSKMVTKIRKIRTKSQITASQLKQVMLLDPDLDLTAEGVDWWNWLVGDKLRLIGSILLSTVILLLLCFCGKKCCQICTIIMITMWRLPLAVADDGLVVLESVVISEVTLFGILSASLLMFIGGLSWMINSKINELILQVKPDSIMSNHLKNYRSPILVLILKVQKLDIVYGTIKLGAEKLPCNSGSWKFVIGEKRFGILRSNFLRNTFCLNIHIAFEAFNDGAWISDYDSIDISGQACWSYREIRQSLPSLPIIPPKALQCVCVDIVSSK